MKRLMCSVLPLIFVAALLSACGGGEGGGPVTDNGGKDPDRFSSMKLSNVPDVMYVGDQLVLSASLTDKTSQIVPGVANISWSSSDPSVATVGANGLLTAVGPGKVEITASVDKVSDVMTVNIRSLEIVNDSKTEVVSADEVKLRLVLHDSDLSSEDVTDQAVWKSDNTAVFSVKENGVFIAGKKGFAIVSVSFDGKTIKHNLQVNVGVESLKLSGVTRNMLVHDQVTISAEAFFTNGTSVTLDSGVSWEFPASLLTLDETSTVLKALDDGQGYIRAKYGDVEVEQAISITDSMKLYVESDTAPVVTLQWKSSAHSPHVLYWNTSGDVTAADQRVEVTGRTTYAHNGTRRNQVYYYRLAANINGKEVLGEEIRVQPRLNEWYSVKTTLGGLPGGGALVVNNKLYMFGGYETKNGASSIYPSVGARDLVTGQETARATMPEARASMAYCSDTQSIFVFGGSTASEQSSDVSLHYDVAINAWSHLEPMPFKRSANACVFHDGTIYVVGGTDGTSVSNRVLAYDIASNTWSEKAAMNTARQNLTVTIAGGALYAIGGDSGTGVLSVVEKYDVTKDIWQPVADTPYPVSLHATSTVGDNVYLTGGILTKEGSTTYSYRCFVYDTAADKWTEKDAAMLYRADHVSYVLGDNLYLIGGVNDTSPRIQLIESFDLVTEEWFPKMPLPFYGSYYSTAAVGTNLYLVGGQRNIGGSISASQSIDMFDLRLNYWVRDVAQLDSPLFATSSIATPSKEVYIMSGHPSASSTTTSGMLQVLDTVSKSVTTTPVPMPTPFPALAFDKDTIYVADAISGKLQIQMYHLSSKEWTLSSELPVSRTSSTSVALDGYVYVIGGTDGVKDFNLVERYDPRTDAWESMAPLKTARYSPTSTVINGKIYVFGGSAATALSTVEIYDPLTNSWSYGPAMPSPRGILSGQFVNNVFYVLGGKNEATGNPYRDFAVFR